MFLTVHATAGAAVGALTGNPVAGFLLGVLSHAVLDIIPHGDEHLAPACKGNACNHREEIRFFMKLAAVDGIVMLGVLAVVLQPWVALPSWAVIAGVAGGVLPDIGQGLGTAFPCWGPFARFRALHDIVHVKIIPFETPVVLGMVTQLAALTFVAGAYRALL